MAKYSKIERFIVASKHRDFAEEQRTAIE